MTFVGMSANEPFASSTGRTGTMLDSRRSEVLRFGNKLEGTMEELLLQGMPSPASVHFKAGAPGSHCGPFRH